LKCDDRFVQMYVDGMLDQGEQMVVEGHFHACQACRNAVVFYKAMLWDLEHAAPTPAPDELQAVSDRLMQAWEAESARPAPAVAGSAVTSWAGASTQWVRTPIVASALSKVGQGGTVVGKSIVRGLTQFVLRGGGWR